MIMSTSACIAILAKSSLYGSPDEEKIGSFWDSTRELNTSIIGIPVLTMFLGIILLDGFTDGPPISIRFSSSLGPLSRGSPLPLKILPRRFSEQEIFIG